MIAELQQLFTEALNEDDFATSTFAKRKLEQVITYDNVIVKKMINSSGGSASAAANDDTSNGTKEEPEDLLALLKDTNLFGTEDPSDDDDEGSKAAIVKTTTASATKLVIALISKVLCDKRVGELLSAGSDDGNDSGGVQQVNKLLALIAGSWLGAGSVGVGSRASGAVVDILLTHAPSAPAAATMKEEEEQSASSPLAALTATIEGALATTSPSYRREAEMRLLDALTQLYTQQQARENELGNRIGLPKAEDKKEQQQPISPQLAVASPLSSIVPAFATHTQILANLFTNTNKALCGLVKAFVGSPTTAADDDDTAAAREDEEDPLLLINLMNAVGALGRYLPSSSAACAPNASEAAFRKLIGETFVHQFLAKVFLSMSSSSPTSATPAAILNGQSDVSAMMAAVAVPFVFRGFAALARNNAMFMGALLVGSCSCGGGENDAASAVDILVAVFAAVGNGTTIPLSVDTAEVVEAIIDFAAAIVSQKGSVVTDMVELLATTNNNTIAKASVDEVVDKLCAAFVVVDPATGGSSSPSSLFMSQLLLTTILYPKQARQ